MSKTLYLFVTSVRPDPYLNSIVHCLLYKAVDKVVFVHVIGLESNDIQKNGTTENGISANVSRRVQTLLESLAIDGEYREFKDTLDRSRIDLSTIYSPTRLSEIKNLYKLSLTMQVSWVHRDVEYLNLRTELARIRKEEPTSLFDITSIKKRYLGDILAASIIEGIANLFTFDAKPTPNFEKPWTMLIHDLQPDDPENRLYNYVNIVDTHIFRECSSSILVRTLPFKISLGIATILLIILVAFYFLYGESNIFIQLLVLASAVASILSTYFNFFPPRR